MNATLSHAADEADNRPSFMLSVESATLIEKMKDGKPGDVFPYQKLIEWIGGSPPRPLMPTVREHLRKEHGVILGCVHGIGYKVLSAMEVLDKGDDYRKRLRNANHRRVNELKTVDPAALPDEQAQGKYYQEVSHTALIHAVMDRSQQKRLEEHARTVRPAPGATMTLTDLKRLFAAAPTGG